MRDGISTNVSVLGKAQCLAGKGVGFVVRYYSKPGSSKAVKRAEADELAAEGILLGVVYQENGRSVGKFTLEHARDHAANAWKSAQEMGQPKGSAIYFAVDYDAPVSDLGVILNYFNEVDRELARLAGGINPYSLGVYGSGRTCAHLKSKCPAVRYAWLSLSRGWADTKTYNGWDLNQTWGDGDLCGLSPVFIRNGELIDGDYEYNASDGEFGGFFPDVPKAILLETPDSGEQEPTTAEASKVASLGFSMELGTGDGLRTGVLTLLDKKGNVLFSAAATSGRPGSQDLGDVWTISQGPLPPADFAVETAGELPESSGEKGVRLAIQPDAIKGPGGVRRGGFAIHGREEKQGTSGGIALLHENDFTEVRRALAVLASSGVSSLPLKVSYTGGTGGAATLKAGPGLKAVFSMKLQKTQKMLYGTFTISNDGEVLYHGVATSGLKGFQHPDAFWTVGHGVVPPTDDDRHIMTDVWANDPPMGTRYQITPERVKSKDGTQSRSAFRVHFDGGVPGSAGCIVTPDPDNYAKIIKLIASLKAKGVEKIPLTLDYTF